MRELFDARLNVEDRPMTQPELVAAVKEADVLVPTITDHIDAALIAQAGTNLKLIANFGNGVDKIDVAAAAKKGITVTNTPNVLTEDTADMTMALMLAGAAAADRRRQCSAPATRNGPAGRRPGCSAAASGASASALSAWAASAPPSPGAPRLSACRSTITTAIACCRRVEDELEATYWESLDQMLARMDIISVNCPSTPATFHLLSARRLALLQPSAYIVNTARGDIIDEDALIKLIQDGKLAGAGLDVFEHEPARELETAEAGRQGQGRASAAYGFGDASKAASTWARR